VYAGYVARRMGLPIRKLVVATNENDVLDEFFRTGRYRVRRKVKETSSPSMDISKASNFERYVFDLVGGDGTRVRDLWRRLDEDGEFDLSRSAYYARVRDTGFVSGRSTHSDRLSTIRSVHERFGVVIDPHTADGVKVGLEHREGLVPLVCLETAAPVKFAPIIRSALGRDPQRPAELADLEKRPQRFHVVANDAATLKRYIETAP
jgi:threonine synthase